jgi:hypothetical protein
MVSKLQQQTENLEKLSKLSPLATLNIDAALLHNAKWRKKFS